MDFDTTNLRVGIGTTFPASLTEIQGGLTTTGAVLTLSSKEPSTVANDVLGRVDFKAALDAAGSDANLVAASVVAIAENTFSATVNETGLAFLTGASEVASERVRIDHHGNVGIGTTSPDQKLTIGSTSDSNTRISLKTSNTGIGDLYWDDAGGTNRGVLRYNHGEDKMYFGTAGTTERMVIDSSGNVGIGTTSPGYLFDVNGVIRATGVVRSDTSVQGGASSPASSPAFADNSQGNRGMYFPTTDQVGFSTGGVERVRIDSGGNFGLGTSSFGTSAAKVLSIGAGTAPTTSPADVSQLWSANQNGAATNALYYRNESGQSGVVAHQAPLVNLLSNSGFGVWSQGTVTATATGAAPVTDGANAALTAGGTLVTNGGFDSATTGWTEVAATLASVAGGKTGNCLEMTWVSGAESGTYQTISAGSLTSGKLYQLSAYVKSGTAGDVSFHLSIGNSGALAVTGTTSGSWVKHTYLWEYPGSGDTAIRVYQKSSTAGTTLFDSITLHEITPGCIASDSKGPDGWSKSSNVGGYPYIYRIQSSLPVGVPYGVQCDMGASTDALFSNSNYASYPLVSSVAGRTVTFGAWVKTSTASAARLYIGPSAGNTYSSYHSGGGGWEWLEVSTAVASNTSVIVFGMRYTAASYIAGVMAVVGPSIGQGNYSAPPGEIVWTDAPIGLTTLDGVTGFSTEASWPTLNMEADTSGKLPKGAKAAYLNVMLNDSGSSGSASSPNFTMRADSTSSRTFDISSAGLANDAIARQQGWQKLDANGDVQYYIGATGVGTADFPVFKIMGVQVN
jgi:hypothetical protein